MSDPKALAGLFATAGGVGFWMNCFVAIKECKPHFFKHNCKECHRTGLMRCPKCDGFGVMERVGVDNRREMTISRRMKESMDDGGMFDCTYCNKKGVKRCEACQGQGWHLSPYLNYRKFQPHPIFEEYHQSRDRMMARDPKYMKALEKANRKQEEERKLKMEEEEYERKREARRKAKELKKEGKEKKKDGKEKKKKDGKEKKKKDGKKKKDKERA